MSSSTTCGLFWVNINTNSVTERVNDIKATCTTDFASCKFPSSFGRDEFSCTNNLMYPATVPSDSKSGYICSCGSAGLQPPDTTLVSCTDDCYKLDVKKQCTILRLSLSSRATFADSGLGKIESQECASLRCGTGENSTICTDQKGSYQYTCNDAGMTYSLLDKGKAYACSCDSKGVLIPNGFGAELLARVDECKGKKAPSGDSSDDNEAPSTAAASGSSASTTGSSSDTESTASSTAASAVVSASVEAGGSGAAAVTLSLKNVISFVGASLIVMGMFA